MPKFEKGNTFSKGRPKGAKNKKTLLTVEEILAETDCNPIRELIRIARETSKEDIEVTCYKEIAKYAYSQKKAVESEVAVDIQPSGFIIARA